MTGFRVTIALPAKARQLSTAALYKGKIKSKNRQMHWTIPIQCSYCTRDTPRYTLRQAQQRILSNLLGESTTAGDVPTKEGVSGILASGRRRLAPVRSAELLSLLWRCCRSFWGLAGWLALPKQPGHRTLGQITAAMNGSTALASAAGMIDARPP